MNDNERKMWVLNYEGFYTMWQASGRGITVWIRENRAGIDEVILRLQNAQ